MRYRHLQLSPFSQELCSPIILILSPRLCHVLLMQPLPEYSCMTARDDSHVTKGMHASPSAPKSEPAMPSYSSAGEKGTLWVYSPTSPGAEPSPAPSQGRRGFVQLNPTKSHGWSPPPPLCWAPGKGIFPNAQPKLPSSTSSCCLLLYHLVPLGRVWLHHICNCPTSHCRLLLDTPQPPFLHTKPAQLPPPLLAHHSLSN